MESPGLPYSKSGTVPAQPSEAFQVAVPVKFIDVKASSVKSDLSINPFSIASFK